MPASGAGLAMMFAIAIPLVGIAIMAFRTHASDRRSRRDVLLDGAALLDAPAFEVAPTGYGVLRGRFEGVDVTLRPFSEALVFRRLPQLWLVVTVRLPNDGDATIDVLRRPTGAEFYSPGQQLPVGYPTPSGWPRDAVVRGSPHSRRLAAAVERPIAALLADPRIKDVVVAPHGVRIVRQLRQGERGAYLLYRDGRFPNPRATQDEVRAAIGDALSLARAVAADVGRDGPPQELRTHAAA